MSDTDLIKKMYKKFDFGKVLRNIGESKRMYATQWFGERPKYYAQFGWKGHNGLDFRAKTGTESFAPIPGTITEVRHDPHQNTKKGEYIRMVSDEFRLDGRQWRLELHWYHIDRSLTVVGERVAKGQKVVLTDNSGAYTSGPHLHFGVYPMVKVGNGWVRAFINNGYSGAINPYPFFSQRAFVNHPKSDHLLHGELVMSPFGPEVYYVDIDLKLGWIGDEKTFIHGREEKWWGDWGDIRMITAKLKEDYSIIIK